MHTFLHSLRPVGNPLTLTKVPLDYTYFGDFHVTFYNSGTASLAAALLAAKRIYSSRATSPEVILPAYACPDLISAILYAGAKPVLVDLEPNSCWMSLAEIQQRITKNTIAVIAVRFLGIAERMTELKSLCKSYDIALIEDSAQGFPVSNTNDYWQSETAILSFGRGKPINMLSGGAVLTKVNSIEDNLPLPAPEQYRTMAVIRYFFKVQAYNILIQPLFYGLAQKLPGLNLGATVFRPLTQIGSLSANIQERLTANIVAYQNTANLAQNIGTRLSRLNTTKIIDLVANKNHRDNIPLLRYPILMENKLLRDVVYKALEPLGASIMYQRTLKQIAGIPESVLSQSESFANAESFASRLMTLPTHNAVTDKVLDDIFARIHRLL